MKSIQSYKFQNMNKINYSTRDFGIVRSYIVPKYIKTKGSIFLRTNNILGQGGHGIVIEYQNKYGERFAVKSLNYAALCKNTSGFLTKLSKVDKIKKCTLKLVKQKCITQDNFRIGNRYITVIVMEKMAGDISNMLYNRPTMKVKRDLIYNVTEAIMCLQEAGECFLDLKPQNVFYDINKQGRYVFKLGDLDGITVFNTSKSDQFTQYAGTTYPPPETWFAYSNSRRIKCTKTHTMWSLGLFILMVFIPEFNYNKFYWDHPNVKESSKREVKKLLKSIRNFITPKKLPFLKTKDLNKLKNIFIIPSKQKRRPTLKSLYNIFCVQNCN